MAINTTNIQAAITAKIAAEDSSVSALDLLRYETAADRYGVAQYYTSAAALPTASSALEGMIALVMTNAADSGNALYLCTGTEWFEMQDLDSAAPYSFQGSNFGYVSGGGPPSVNVIEKFPFATDANATDVGDLTVARWGVAGQSSTLSGYTSGGYGTSNSNIIDKFPFASDGNASDVGDLTEVRYGLVGQSSENNGYASGGINFTFSPIRVNIIDKFPFSTDANATDVGDLTQGTYTPAGQNSTTHGYASGGANTNLPVTTFNNIEKFPFAADANATDVGDLTVARFGPAGQSSTDNGYTSGGGAPAVSNVIDKFPFAADVNATDVGDLSQVRNFAAGQSSTNNGYTSGGAPAYNTIDKFPFSSDANATDVGDLTTTRTRLAGQQY